MKLKIISDGTNAGTKLIDEDTGKMIHLIQKLSWEADAKEWATKVTVEFINIPVEIISKAEVELLDYNKETWELEPSKTFEKNVKIESEGQTNKTYIKNADTGEVVGAVQKIAWEATPEEIKTKVTRIKFDNKDW